MTDIASALVEKYGLKQAPSDDQVQQWATIADSLMKSGTDKETASEDAAKQAFPELFGS